MSSQEDYDQDPSDEELIDPEDIEDLPILEDSLAMLKGQEEGLRRLMVEYLEIPVQDGLDFAALDEFLEFGKSFQSQPNRKKDDLLLPLQTFLQAITTESRNKYYPHSDRDTSELYLPDFGLYQAGVPGLPEIEDGFARGEPSEMLMSVEQCFDCDPIMDYKSTDRSHRGFTHEGINLTRLAKTFKRSRQAPFFVLIYIYNAASFRLMVLLPDHLFSTERIPIARCKAEFLSLLIRLSNMDDDDYQLLQKVRKLRTPRGDITHVMTLRTFGMSTMASAQEEAAAAGPSTVADRSTVWQTHLLNARNLNL